MATNNDYLTRDPDIRAALAVAAEGTAYFERTLAEIPDHDLNGASLLPDWTRRHVIAHVGLNATGLLRLVQWAKTGVKNPMYASQQERNDDIERGAALEAGELRELALRTAKELDDGWRGLADENWRTLVRKGADLEFPASTTIWLRTREVWLHAVDLNSSASFDDFPPAILDRLRSNVLSSWRARREAEDLPNFVLSPTDRGMPKGIADVDDPQALVLRGTIVDLVRWATGRGQLGVVTANGEPAPTAPRWV